MTQTINYFTKALGATPAANHNAGTPQPLQGSRPALTQQNMGIAIKSHSDYAFSAAGDPLATGDIYVTHCLPKDHELLDVILEFGDIDAATALVFTFGQLLPDFTDIVAGTEMVINTTAAQAGGVVRASNVAGMILPSQTTDLWYGLKVTTGSPGQVNAAAACRVVLEYVPSETYSVTLPATLYP